MRQIDRLTLRRKHLWACGCFCLLAMVAGLSVARAGDGLAPPIASPPDASRFDIRDDPYSTYLTGIKWMAPDYRDYKTPDVAPRPSDIFPGDNIVDQNRRSTAPAVLPSGFQDLAVRGGWWYVGRHGSETKVGEYQGLTSSPFWDVELLKSNGVSTLDLFGRGMDNETTQSGLYLFTPSYEANLRYERFIHRLDHDPLTNMPPPGSGAEIVAEDLDAGDDYAVRIQDIRTDVSGKLAENVKYDLDIWIRRKKGERQALGTHHGMAFEGYPCRVCHVQSETQQIDWLSTRVEPAIEARFGLLTARYSRPMRFFGQNDSVVTRSYGSFHPYNDYTTDSPYAVVPETVSQTDRLKLRAALPQETVVFSQLFRGTTDNLQRDTHRGYYGVDLRSLQFIFPPHDTQRLCPLRTAVERTAAVPGASGEHSRVCSHGHCPSLRSPQSHQLSANFHRSGRRLAPLSPRVLRRSAGGESGIRNRGNRPRLRRLPGREPARIRLSRSYVIHFLQRGHFHALAPAIRQSTVVHAPRHGKPTVRAEQLLRRHQYQPSHIRGCGGPGHNMAGRRQFHDHRQRLLREPPQSLFCCGLRGKQLSDDLHVLVCARPSWSISGGYGIFSNWINQDMYFPGNDPQVEPLDRQLWNYGGRGQTLSIGASHTWGKQLTFSGSLQQVWATDATDPLAPWPDLPSYFDVQVNTRRYVCGVDWCGNSHVSAYLRYIYDDYDDGSAPYNSGRAHMVLAGLAGTR